MNSTGCANTLPEVAHSSRFHMRAMMIYSGFMQMIYNDSMRARVTIGSAFREPATRSLSINQIISFTDKYRGHELADIN